MKKNASTAILSAADPRRLDTLDEHKAMIAACYSPDVATVVLAIGVVTSVQLLLLGTLAGRRWRLFAARLVQDKYLPGLVTSIGYVWIGVMILQQFAVA